VKKHPGGLVFPSGVGRSQVGGCVGDVVRGLSLWGGPAVLTAEREVPGVAPPAGRGRTVVVGRVTVTSVGGRSVRFPCRSVFVSGSVGGGKVCDGTGLLVCGGLCPVLSVGVKSGLGLGLGYGFGSPCLGPLSVDALTA